MTTTLCNLYNRLKSTLKFTEVKNATNYDRTKLNKIWKKTHIGFFYNIEANLEKSKAGRLVALGIDNQTII